MGGFFFVTAAAMASRESRLTVKVSYCGDIRRITMNRGASFDELRQIVSQSFSLDPATFYIKYFDEDQDKITISCDEEFQEAISYLTGASRFARLYVLLKGQDQDICQSILASTMSESSFNPSTVMALPNYPPKQEYMHSPLPPQIPYYPANDNLQNFSPKDSPNASPYPPRGQIPFTNPISSPNPNMHPIPSDFHKEVRRDEVDSRAPNRRFEDKQDIPEKPVQPEPKVVQEVPKQRSPPVVRKELQPAPTAKIEYTATDPIFCEPGDNCPVKIHLTNVGNAASKWLLVQDNSDVVKKIQPILPNGSFTVDFITTAPEGEGECNKVFQINDRDNELLVVPVKFIINKSEPSPPENSELDGINKDDLASIVDMGFTISDAIEALKKTNGDLNAALNLCLGV